MGGGILQLVANENSIPDLWLTGDPQITHFKILFRRATPFSMFDSNISINSNVQLGDSALAHIRPQGDMLHVLSLVIDVPTPIVGFKDPIYRTVRDLLIPCGLEQIIDQIALSNGDTLDDPVTYEYLFGPDITNPSGPLADAINDRVDELDIIYSKRLEVLDRFKTEYNSTDSRYVGKYIAIKPEFIDFAQFEGTGDDVGGESTKPIDPAGYLVMKVDRTQAFYDQYISNPAINFVFNCSDFMYDPRSYAEYLDGESVYDTTLSPEAIPVMKYLIRTYPRQIPEYLPIRTVADYDAIMSDVSKNHSIIMPISQIDICRRVLLHRVRLANSLGPDDINDLDALNRVEIDECLFGDISINDLLDAGFEIGAYSFDPDFNPDDLNVESRAQNTIVRRITRSIPDYDTCVADLFRMAKIKIPIISVDREVTVEITSKFNRYCKNENAIYNKTYDLRTPLRTPNTLSDVNGETYVVDTDGYWLLDVSLIDRLTESIVSSSIDQIDQIDQDVITQTPDPMDTDILINPIYLDARSDRLDYAPHIISRVWIPQILKSEIVDSQTGVVIEDDGIDSTNPQQVQIFSKPENIVDGIDMLSDMIQSIYSIEDVELASDISQILNNDLFNLEDIEAYHGFLEAIRKDLLNTENQISDYRLNSASGCDNSNIFSEFDPSKSISQTLFNSRDLQQIMTGKLLRDIIYVDQTRFTKLYYNEFNLYFKRALLIDFVSVTSAYIKNGNYILAGTSLTDRELAHRLTKYIMWSKHLENIDVQSRTSTTAEVDLASEIDQLSKTLIQMAVDSTDGSTFDYLKNIRYGKDDINDITDCVVYEDDSIIERFRTNDVVDPTLNWFERDNILSGVRFNSDNLINNQIEDLRDLVGSGIRNPTFIDGRGSCINREVELYHVLRTIDHNSSANLSKLLDHNIRDYFLEIISESYEESRSLKENYVNTISYRAIVKYLDEFFANTFALSSELSVEEITRVLIEIAQNTVIITLNDYNRYLFYVWKNSSYVDKELDPRITTDTLSVKFPPVDVRLRTFVDFDTADNDHTAFLTTCYPNRIDSEPDLNPDLLKAKCYSNVDEVYRPRMGYGFTFNLDFGDESTYRSEKSTVLEEREFTFDQSGGTSIITTPSPLGTSSFKDDYSEYIDNQVNRVKNEMKDVINYGPSNQSELETADVLRENLVYTDWFDLQGFQTFAVERLASDRGVTDDVLSYYDDTYVMNHLPMTLSYYYGMYAQSIYRSIYTALEEGDTNLIEGVRYDMIESQDAESEDKSSNLPILDATIVATGVLTDSILQFLSTDIGEDPECPIHSNVSNLSTAQTAQYDRYLIDNIPICTITTTTTTPLPSYTLSSGNEPILTANVDGVLPVIGGMTLVVGDTVSLVNGAVISDNGLYVVADLGSGFTRWILASVAECPLCFRTYAMSNLFKQLSSTIFTSNSSVSTGGPILENNITDNDYIELIRNGTVDEFDRDGRYKNIFIYRPEMVYYDTVTETFYDTAIQFFLLRYSTIFYRYSKMVRKLSEISQSDYDLIMAGLVPSPATIFGQMNSVTYSDYKDHLDQLRTDSAGQIFEHEVDLFCKSVMHNPSDDLINSLKIASRTISSTTQYADYTRGEETIYEYNPNRVIQNIVIDPDSTITRSFFSIRHMMYRGNVSVWYTIQRRVIDLYNEYLNNLLDFREIESNADLFIETYNILQDIIPDQYTDISSSNRRLIDFYRFKQVTEVGQDEILEIPLEIGEARVRNDLIKKSIDMITYVRETQIYYKMLIARYEKRKFLLEIKNQTLDNNTFYFEKSDTIAKGFLDQMISRVEGFNPVEVVLSSASDRECFFFQDTTNLYYLDSLNFRTTTARSGNPEFVEDYRNFNHLNSYHLSQGFTFNQTRDLFRMVGFMEQDEQKVSSLNSITSIRVPAIFRDLDLQYTEEFQRYRTLRSMTNDLDNTSIYMKQELVYNITTSYEHKLTPIRAINRGLFYDIWKNYPTISNILYDLDFDPVAFNDTDDTGVFDKYYTGINSSSPLNILKNRLEQFDLDDPMCGNFHTPELKSWEAKYICSKVDQFDALKRVFNVYYFLTGGCDYQDIFSNISFARIELMTGAKSLNTRLEELDLIALDVIKSLGRGFTIGNDQLRVQNMQTTIILLKNRHTASINSIKTEHLSGFTCIRERIDLIAGQFDFYTRSLTEAEITVVLDDIYSQLAQIDSVIFALTIDDILSGIETGILDGSISDLMTLTAMVNFNLDAVQVSVETVVAELDAKLLIIQEQSCLKFTFIRSTKSELVTDHRVHTPIRLFNLKEIQLMNNFKHVEDVMRFLISGVVALMTPTTDRITTIYLDGVITDAESVLLDADRAKSEVNSRANLPSIFDGGFNTIFADLLGDSNPFRTGNYFGTSLCESMNTLFSQIKDIDSETISYQNMIDDVIRSIQLKFNVMDKLAVLTRYVDLTKSPVCGFFFYDLDRFIPFDSIDQSSTIRQLKNYNQHKEDARRSIIKNNRIGSQSAVIDKYNKKKSIYNQSNDGGLIDAKLINKKKYLTDTNRTVRQTVRQSVDANDNITDGIQVFVISDVYERILKVLRVTDAKPKHAWARQLGLRMIEELTLIIDGEEIDGYDSELLLLLRKGLTDIEHDRGVDIMIGHIPEMYEISGEDRPALKLYINTYFSFSRFPGCSMPLINMLYSNIFLRLKLRCIEELLYIEPGAELKKPVKIDAKFMGRFIILESEERKRLAISRTQTIMERYRGVRNINTSADIKQSKTADGGKARGAASSGQNLNNVNSSAKVDRLIKQRYYFEDPTKFLMWRMRLIYPNKDPKDILYWDLAEGSEDENRRLGLVDENGNPILKIKLFDRAKVQMNSITRDNWRQEEYHRLMVPLSRRLRALDLNEGMYSFAIYLKGLGPQPAGATNLTMIDNLTMFFDMSEELVRALNSGARLDTRMYQCSHNIFTAMSGFGALNFYGTH
jgi:hypothetical protein